ncbi:MAG TPA: Gfo/Idh/MocA family oxidoreductase [Patescibacteria group bacterium]|nr:Gfo/Idh/MocA family oxidoreductase [Patescibacteria group bacterium]
MEKIGIALIGAGNVAQNVHLPILKKLPNVNLIAVCDQNKSHARAIAEKFNIPNACKSIEELLEIEGIQAVDVCATTSAHAEIAIACMERGKDILVEKPLARTFEEAKLIADAADRFGAKLMVGMNHRFRPDNMMLKSAVENGELGSIFYVKAGIIQQRSSQQKWLSKADVSGGGVLIDLGIVMVDLILWLYNFADVRSVNASMYHHQTKSVEDVVIATINFENGSVATLEASWSLMRPEDLYYCNVFGKKGSGYTAPFRLVQKKEGEFFTMGAAGLQPGIYYGKSYENELKHFINAVSGHVPIVSTGHEAVERMRIIEALYQSAREEREIVLE